MERTPLETRFGHQSEQFTSILYVDHSLGLSVNGTENGIFDHRIWINDISLMKLDIHWLQKKGITCLNRRSFCSINTEMANIIQPRYCLSCMIH